MDPKGEEEGADLHCRLSLFLFSMRRITSFLIHAVHCIADPRYRLP